jgi:hypothetical protein
MGEPGTLGGPDSFGWSVNERGQIVWRFVREFDPE